MCNDYFIPSADAYKIIYGMFLSYWEGTRDLGAVSRQFEEFVSAYNRGRDARDLVLSV